MILSLLHFSKAAITYGVVPEAAIPITMSFCVIKNSFKSSQPLLIESSEYSTAFLIALSPPAIKPMTKSWETPNVGGHSEASKTPNRPLVPAPM